MSQTDLFGFDGNIAKGQQKRLSLAEQHERWARSLEETGEYQILRNLPKWHVVDRAPRAGEKVGIVLDTETTGLDHLKDEVIELSMIKFLYTQDGIVQDVIGIWNGLQEPSVRISSEISSLTGITDEMVRGKSIDRDEVAEFIAGVDVILAHHAGFDRSWSEGIAIEFCDLDWGCSATEINWSQMGFEGSKLSYLVGQAGYFYKKHRATDDCHALLRLLARDFTADLSGTGLKQLLSAIERTQYRIWAVNAPFQAKDTLKNRGYRWNDGANGSPKSWWIDLNSSDQLCDERAFLEGTVYHRQVTLPVDELSSRQRFRAVKREQPERGMAPF